MKVKILGNFSYQTSPETEDMIEVSEEDLKNIGKTKKFNVEQNSIEDYAIPEEVFRAIETEKLRRERIFLLSAFDKWEKAVLRGREADNDAIMEWYRNLLDLKKSAFADENIPERIKYYL